EFHFLGAAMKKTLSMIAAVAALVGTPALAADMAVKAPPPAPAAPVYGWTGFYIGVEAGGAWGGRVSFAPNDPLSALVANGTGGLPGEQPLVSRYSLNRNGPVGGFEIGYNWQAGSNFLIGLQTDISFSGVSGTASGTSVLTIFGGTTALQSTTSHQDTEWYGTLRGRLGWLVAPNLMFFGTGGLAYGRTSVTANETFTGAGVTGFGGGFTFNCLTSGAPCFAGAGAAVRTGWTAGGGVEYLLDAHWSAKIEYQFVDLGTQLLTVAAVTPTPGTTASSFTAAFRDQMNVVRLGLNYRF